MQIWAVGLSNNAFQERAADGREAIERSSFFRAGDRALFVYGFAKSDQTTLSPTALADAKAAAAVYLRLREAALNTLILRGELTEVLYP